MPRHEKHPPFRWVSLGGTFYCKTGDFLRFLSQTYPPGGVRAIYIYIYLYIYTHIHIYAVGSITWPFFGHFRVNNLAMVGSITWPSFFEPIKIGFF